MNWDFYLASKVTGVLVFIFAGGRAASKSFGITYTRAVLINTLAVFIAFCSSRLWFIVQNEMGAVLKGASLLDTWNDAGSVLYGWILGGAAGVYFLTREFKLPFVRYIDAVCPWMLITQFLNRLGCADAGCCFGKLMANGQPYPIQLVEGIYDTVLFAFIMLKARRPGESMFLYFTGYATARFFFEFLRGDNQPAFLFMTVPQVTSVLVLFLAFRYKKSIISPIAK